MKDSLNPLENALNRLHTLDSDVKKAKQERAEFAQRRAHAFSFHTMVILRPSSYFSVSQLSRFRVPEKITELTNYLTKLK